MCVVVLLNTNSMFSNTSEIWPQLWSTTPEKFHQYSTSAHGGLGDEVVKQSISGIFNPFFSLQPDLNDERVFWYKVCAEVTGCWWECVWWWSADHTGQSEARDPKKAVREAYFLFGVAFVHAQLYKSAMFYTSAERPPALGDVDVMDDTVHWCFYNKFPLL